MVVTRTEAIPVLTWLVVAPVTRTFRNIPTEVRLGVEHGLPAPCVASFDNLQPIRATYLTGRVGALPHARTEICRALGSLADC